MNQNINYLGSEQIESGGTIIDFLRILFKWKKPMLIFFSTVVLISLFITFMSPDIYQSVATILIKAGRENTLLDPTTTLGEVTTVRRDLTTEINSEIQILKSRDLANQAVEEIGLGPFEQNHNFISENVLKVKAALKASFQMIWNVVSSLIGGTNESDTSLRMTGEQLKKEKIIQSVMNSFSCEGADDSNVIVLKYESRQPELAQKILKELMQNYFEKHMSVHRTDGSYDFFRRQTETLQKDLENTAKNLNNLKNETGISSVETQRTLLLERIDSLQNTLTDLKSNLAGAEKKMVLLHETLENVPRTMVQEQRTGSPSSAVEELRKQVYLLNLEEQELLSKFSQESVPITEIRRRIVSAEKLLAIAEETQEITSGVNNTYQQIEMDIMLEKASIISLRETKKEVEQQLHNAKKELEKLNNNEIQLTNLERKYNIDEANYRKYSEGKEQARIDSELENGNISNVSIAQECTLPIEPVRPNRKLNIGMGIFFGIVGALGLAFFLEYFSHTFSTPEDIEKRVGIPSIGSLPNIQFSKMFSAGLENRGQVYLPSDNIKMLPEKNISQNSEHLNEDDEGETDLKSLIDASKYDLNGKVLAITSSRPGEGVSTFSIYFSSMLRNTLEKKVLLIDTNFDNPNIHKILGGDISPGLWDMMIKRNEAACFQKNPVYRFEYLSTGKKNYVNLSNNGKTRIKHVLNELKKKYDFIILDTSPIWNGSVARVSEFESMADGVILVVEAEKLRWEVVRRSKERLDKINAKVMGAVLNKRRYHIPEWLYNKF